MSRGVLAGWGQRHLSGTQVHVLRALACPRAMVLFGVARVRGGAALGEKSRAPTRPSVGG